MAHWRGQIKLFLADAGQKWSNDYQVALCKFGDVLTMNGSVQSRVSSLSSDSRKPIIGDAPLPSMSEIIEPCRSTRTMCRWQCRRRINDNGAEAVTELPIMQIAIMPERPGRADEWAILITVFETAFILKIFHSMHLRYDGYRRSGADDKWVLALK